MEFTDSFNFQFSQVILTGATGQVGHRILECLTQIQKQQNLKIIATEGGHAGFSKLDLDCNASDLQQQLSQIEAALDPGKPTVLIHTAAYTNVEGCESDPARCKRINEDSTVQVFLWARDRLKAKIVFYSSDYVFDGVAGPYLETAQRSPVSVYGEAKAFVESWLEQHNTSYLIIRTTGVFDYRIDSKNFVMQMLELWKQGKITRIPQDQFSNPVWAMDLAQDTLKLLNRSCNGIFNIAGGSLHARSEFAGLIALVFECNPALIEPVLTKDLGQKARRPLNGGLLLEKLKTKLQSTPLPARDALVLLKNMRDKR